MPIIKSAKKRTRIANKATIRNRKTKRSLKSANKEFLASLTGDKKQASELLSTAQSELDKAVKKGVLHQNKANRKKAKLAKVAKEAGVKPAPSSPKVKSNKPAAKTTAKKAPAKKATAKTAPKIATKKAPAKK